MFFNRLTCFIVACLVSTLVIAGQYDVKYTHNGKEIVVTGEKVKSNKFVYNKGAAKKVKIATLDWDPYIAAEICNQGWVQQATIAVLASKGYEITSEFYPWARAVSVVEKGDYDILYPEYFIEKDAKSDVHKGKTRLEFLSLSKEMPGGPIAFMQRKSDPVKFDGDLKKLKNVSIGVVRGYQNTPDFDKLMENGYLNTSEANDDLSNAKKLYAKRVDLIIGDPLVIKSSIAKGWGQKSQEVLGELEIVEPHLQYNNLYFAVSKLSKNHDAILADVNAAIEDFTSAKTFDNIITATENKCLK